MPVAFLTKGDFPIASFTLYGNSVKPNSSSPIGYFGTGLKYAIAVLLRNNCSITIRHADDRLGIFFVQKEDFRGTAISRIFYSEHEDHSNAIALPFTLDFGKNWTVLNALRELMCNTMDEGGLTLSSPSMPHKPGHTCIFVEGSAIDAAYNRRGDIFLYQKTPLYKNHIMEIYPNPSKSPIVYYRGVAVHALQKTPIYTYNLLLDCDLTEDRTLKHPHMFSYYVGMTLPDLLDENMLLTLRDKHDSFEYSCPFSEYTPIAEDLAKRMLELSRAGSYYPTPWLSRAMAESKDFSSHVSDIPEKYRDRLSAALNLLQEHGLHIEYKVAFLDDPKTLGLVRKSPDAVIYISAEAFRQGSEILVGTLIEEYVHKRYSYQDETREFQNYLLNTLATLICKGSL